jgi:hypothetical protein
LAQAHRTESSEFLTKAIRTITAHISSDGQLYATPQFGVGRIDLEKRRKYHLIENMNEMSVEGVVAGGMRDGDGAEDDAEAVSGPAQVRSEWCGYRVKLSR